MKTSYISLALILLAACKRGNPEEFAVSGPEPPPAAALVRGGATLDSSLVALERELDAALSDASQRIERMKIAEAMTDRLLETQQPFQWLKSRYGVDAMLRQIQSLADRIQAQMRTDPPPAPDVLQRDMRDLREKVRSLRAALREGGGPAPLSLDSLLALHARDSLVITDRGE